MRNASLSILLLACGEPTVAPQAPTPASEAPASEPASLSQTAGPVRIGKVLEVVEESPKYTYARMDACGSEAWVAGPKVEMAVGQTVEMVGGQGMPDFKSAHLQRTFEQLLMVDAWRLADKEMVCDAEGDPSAPDEPMRFGTIKEKLTAGSYTYLSLDVCGEETWVAGPQRPDLKVGGFVATEIGMDNAGFVSKSLGRSFDSMFFVEKLIKAKGLPPCPPK